MSGPEKTFENKVKKYLKDNGCWYVKFFACGMTKSGVPDILACIGGHFVGIEVKSDTGKPSALQLYNRDKIRESDGISIVLYPDKFEDFKEMVQFLKVNHLSKVFQEVFD